jgi:hypothetical protein
MAVQFSQVASLVVAGLNAAGTYTSIPLDPRFYSGQIQDACNASDGAVIDNICSNPMHPERARFLASFSIPHGTALPNHIGPPESVLILGHAAQIWSKAEIEHERDLQIRNSVLSGIVKFDPHYWLDNNILYHNYTGGSATVSLCTYVMSTASPPVLQSPDEYLEAVASKTLAFLFNIEGEQSAAAEFYDNHWRAFENSIKGARAMPEFDLYMAQPQG